MVSEIVHAFRSGVTNIKMTSLNCVDEILIRLSDCCVRILWVKFVVHGHKTILKTFAKVY